MDKTKATTKWAQDKRHIYLRFDIIPSDTDVFILCNNILSYKSPKYGYDMKFELLYDVDNEFEIKKSHYYQLILNKTDINKELWPSVNKGFTRADKNWLRIDWDRWIDDDKSDESDKMEITMPSYSDNSDDTDFSIHSSSGSDSQDHSDQE